MKRVIKNKKKMKNTMYIVLGTFALALFAITRSNPSFAEEGLIIDDALDAVAQQITSGSGGFEKVEEEKMIQPVEEDEGEDEDVVESEVTPVEEIEEGEGEDSQDLDDTNLEGDDGDMEDNADKTVADADETVEDKGQIEEDKGVDSGDNSVNEESHGVSNENMDEGEECLGDFGFKKSDNTIGLMSNGFKVTYDLNGGYWTEDTSRTPRQVTYAGNEGGITHRRTPSRDDECMENGIVKKCMFDGWYLTGLETRFTGNVDSDMTVYAKWLPFEDKEIMFNNGISVTIMDRNIGAITGNINSTGSYGYYFQWGNNYGFKLKGDNGEVLPNGEPIISSELDSTIENDVSTYYYSVWRKSKWSDYHSNLWGGGQSSNSDELKQGPCPKGYHVPDKEEWSMLINLMGTNRGQQISNILNLPFAGYTRSNPNINYEGTDGGYLAVNPNGKNMNYEMYLYKNGTSELSFSSEPYYGASVRCFRNFQVKDINFNSKGGTEITQPYTTTRIFESRPLPDSYVMKKNLMTFEGRYTSEDFREGTKVTTTAIAGEDGETEIELYAHWLCASGYVLAEDNQTCENVSVNFRFNGGVFSGEDKYVVKSSTKNMKNEEVKYSHTMNIDDEGNVNGNYGVHQNNSNTTEVVTIPGAKKLSIRIIYGTEYDSMAWVSIWQGNHPDYEAYNYTDRQKSISGKLGGGNHNDNVKNYVVYGDSVTFSFYNQGYYNYSGKDGYGYYAIISEVDDFLTEYSGDAFDNIPEPTREGYSFDGWYFDNETFSHEFSGTEVTTGDTMDVYAKWKINQYKIMFDTDGGSEINPIIVNYGERISVLTPIKECNEFSGWENLPETMPAHDITLKAKWNYTCSRSSGGGGRKLAPDTSEMDKPAETTAELAIENEHNSATDDEKGTSDTDKPSLNEETSKEVISVTQEIAEDGTEVEVVVEAVAIKNTNIVATVRTETPVNGTNSSSSSSSTHTKEQADAYSFAKSNGITTTESIEQAKMNTELTRIQMAKMLSNFAINVLGQEPDTEKGVVKFDDVTNKMDKQYDNAVTKAYQLGIMGQNVKNNEFRPNDEVTRAEFASALSRLLYQTEEGEYKGTGKYYIPHVAKLYNEGIINKADPKIKEKRGYVMTMLKRTVE